MRGEVPAPLDDALVLTVVEFLEVASHTLLWARGLYPSELFQRARYCGFNARRSRHPGLNAYIGSVISNLKGPLKSRALQEVALVFFDPSGVPLERVTFDIKLAAPGPGGGVGSWTSLDIPALEASFTSVLLVLSCADSFSRPLPQGSTFELLAYSTSRQGLDMNFFCEDSDRSAELRRPISAQALKSVQVEGCGRLTVLLEQGAGAGTA